MMLRPKERLVQGWEIQESSNKNGIINASYCIGKGKSKDACCKLWWIIVVVHVIGEIMMRDLSTLAQLY